MQLTEVRVKLCDDQVGRLKAFCSLTFDHSFVVRDVKLIDGNDGLFLAMPARKLSDHCPRCSEKNHLRARYCSNCGMRLDESRFLRYQNGNGASRLKLHADIAHPINAGCRHEIEASVIAAYQMELERSKQPGYISPNLDGEDLDFYDLAGVQSDEGSSKGLLRHTGIPA
jgi:stage V sporulation protein G